MVVGKYELVLVEKYLVNQSIHHFIFQIINYVVDLIACCSDITKNLLLPPSSSIDRNSPSSSSSLLLQQLDQLRLGFILRLLKSQHFGARMHALKEVI
jgi:hypothetical protein